MVAFKFDPRAFVSAGAERAEGNWSATARAFIGELRDRHAELSGWDDLALGCAWASYSKDILAVAWSDWMDTAGDAFLAYVYVRQTRPAFVFSGTGLFSSDIEELGDQRPWLAWGLQAAR
jgi:hypothetical protein